MEQARDYFASGLGRIVGFLPSLVSAIVIVAVGYLLSRLADGLVRRLLARAGFDRFAARHFPATGRRTASSIAGSTVFWLGILITASMAANSLGLGTLSAGINKVLGFIPNVLVAAVIIGIAIPIGRLLAGLVGGVTNRSLARAVQAAVLVFAVFMALDQLGVSRTIVTTTFTALLGAVAVAAAIAFGVGNIGMAREMTGRWVRRSEARRQAAVAPEREAPTTAEEIKEATKH